MGSESDPLFDLAAAISDGSGVDWGSVEGQITGLEQRRLVEQLRLIAMIADMHRSQDDLPEPIINPERQHGGTTEAKPPGPATNELERWGDLILIEEVGQGSFGTVYRAHDPQLDRPVAVKLLRRTFFD